MNTAPPKLADAPPSLRVVGWAMSLVLASGMVVVYCFDPTQWHIYPVCQFHALTGWNCPGCGGTRAAYALLHGHFLAALRDNAFVVLFPVILALRYAWCWWNYRRGRTGGAFFPGYWIWPLLVLMLVFTVLRNLPAFAFLSP